MHEQDMAVIKALVPIAWADGHFADREKEMLDALLEAYHANDDEKADVAAYAAVERTLDDIDPQELSATDRRTVLQHAVLLTFVDGEQGDEERKMLGELVTRLHLPEGEAKEIMDAATKRAERLLGELKS